MPVHPLGPTLVSLTLAMMAVPSAADAQTAQNVALVINETSPASVQVGEYYAKRRGVPPGNIIRIRTSTNETIDRATFINTIDAPLASALAAGGLQDRILYIVLTKGVPIRIERTGNATDTVASVDSELTLLYRRMTGLRSPIVGRVENPYHLGSRSIGEAKPFTHREHDIYLVTRLDGFTVDDVIGLIDRAVTPTREGQVVLDQQNKVVNRMGEDWLEEAAARLKAAGHSERVLLETTATAVRDVKPVIGYYSWGSNDANNRTRSFKMGFVPGAIAGLFVSSDGRTFREPPQTWVPTGDSDRSKWYAGTPQSLIGDLIREGVTGVAGHVAEPFLQSTVRPEILFPAYLAGFNLAEAYYLAMPHLSWQNIVVGDPLCAPFRDQPLTAASIGDAIDPDTRMPGLFSGRRVATLKAAMPNVPENAVKLVARAETLGAHNDRAGLRSALEEATRLAPNAVYAQLQLAMLYDSDERHDAAADRYRRVLETQPNNGIALNNLAYTLSVRRKELTEALPFARRAVATDPQSPVFLDTLAWIEHLMGNHAVAATRIAVAVSRAPQVAEIRLHAAAINAAAGARGVAEKELAAALKLQPSLEASDLVKEVRARLQPTPARQ